MTLLVSDQAPVPVTWGCRHPVILLPAQAAHWSSDQLREMLLHELAHIKRCDQLIQLMTQLVCALYWFNPLAWVAAYCVRVEQESACDDEVLNAGAQPSVYGVHLMEIARSLRASRGAAWSAVPIARHSRLRGRIHGILDEGRNRTPASRRRWLTAWLLLAFLALPLACVSLKGSAPAGGTEGTEDPGEMGTIEVTGLTRFTLDDARDESPTWSPDGKWMAFCSKRSGNRDIWLKSTDGGQAIQLTTDPARDQHPTWSPTGTEVAFASNRESWGDIWIAPASGGPPRRVTAPGDSAVSANAGMLSWSPDGRELVYASSKGGHVDSRWNLWAIPASGGPARRLTEGPGRDHYPSWSPDGTEVAFCRGQVGTRDLWIVPASGGEPRRLTTHSADDFTPAWSPNGRWLAFVSKRSGNADIWLIPRTGGSAVPLTRTPESVDVMPQWSPDGKRIAVTSSPVLNGLWIMPAAGGEATLLTDRVLPISWARTGSWSPDGSEVGFLMDGPEGIDIWRVPAAGGDPVRVTRGGVGLSGLSWSPDGRLIAFVGGEGGRNSVSVVPARGGDVREVASTAGYHGSVSWSPDSRRLIFGANPGESWDIWVAPLTAGRSRCLVDWLTVDFAPDWSPNGETIAFVSFKDEDGLDDYLDNIWTIPAKGGEATWLSKGNHPDWSADSRELLFEHRGDIWRMPGAGGEPVSVLETPPWEFWPQWSPDGSRILFNRMATGESDIWIADVSGLGSGTAVE